MTKDFNIRNRNWDPSYPHHSAQRNILMEVTDSLKLKLSPPIHQILTQYANNTNNFNSVIDLMFLWPYSVKVDNYFILPDSQYSLDYALLVVDIFISKEFIQDKWWTINRNSEEKERFVTELMITLENIDMTNISSKESLKNIVQEYTRISNST